MQASGFLQGFSPIRWARRVNWRLEALYLCCVGMETCLLVPVYLVLRVQGVALQEGGFAAQVAASRLAPAPVAVTVGLLLAGMVLGLRTFFDRELPLLKQQAILTGLILGSLLVALRIALGAGQPWWSLRWLPESIYQMAHTSGQLPLPLLASVGMLVLWWRGVSLAQRNLTLATTAFAFRCGVLVLILDAAALALYCEPAWAPPFVVAYFFYGLLAVSLARVEELAAEGGAVGSAFSGRWLGILALASIGLTALGVLLSAVYSLEGIQQVLIWLSPLWRVLEGVLYALLSVLGRLLEPLLIWVIELARGLLSGFSLQGLSALELPAFEPPPPGEPSLAQRLAGETLRYGCLGGLLFLALLVILFILPARRHHRPQVEETRESLWSGQDFLEGAADALRKGSKRLQEVGRLVARYGMGRTFFRALTVRRVYARMCHLAQERGHPRNVAQTPYEYLHVLPQAFPECEEELRIITAAYVQVHYGETPASPEQWDQVLVSWQRVQAAPPPTHHPAGDSR
mgnify:CR=1 FL=1